MSSIGSGKKRAEEAPDEHKRRAGKPSDVGRIASTWNVQLAFYDSALKLRFHKWILYIFLLLLFIQ